MTIKFKARGPKGLFKKPQEFAVGELATRTYRRRIHGGGRVMGVIHVKELPIGEPYEIPMIEVSVGYDLRLPTLQEDIPGHREFTISATDLAKHDEIGREAGIKVSWTPSITKER